MSDGPLTPAAAASGPPVPSRLPLVVALLAFVLLAFRQAAFQQRYAVDVLYWDAWDLYQPLFDGHGLWAAFDQQHGPHRQGLGGLWVWLVAPCTAWDCTADAAAVGGALIAAVPLGLLLAWRCGVRGWPLAAVPVVVLNVRQYQMLVALANPAHGAFPVLLLTTYALAWFVRPTAGRLSLVVGLTFCLVFTGFGIFAGPLTPVLLAIEGVQAARRGDRRRAIAAVVALAATGLVWTAFAHGYHADPASAHFGVRRPPAGDYARFAGLLLANYAGVPGDGPVAIAVGLAVAAGGAAVCGVRLGRVLRRGVTADRPSVALFCLAGFGLLYAADAAVGRTPDGYRLATSSRYVTLLIPTGLAVLLHLGTGGPTGRRLAVAWGGLLALTTTVLREADVASAQWAHDGCLRWRAAYLVTHDQSSADRLARFAIYPEPTLGDRLRYLESHRLNLFDPAVYGPPPAAATPARR